MFIPQNPPRRTGFHDAAVISQAVSDFPFPVDCLYVNARAGLLTSLKKEKQMRAVWLPAFICRNILKPFITANFEIKLYDIDRALMPVFPAAYCRPGDYFLSVHFFGRLMPMESIRAFCNARQMVLIEDCAHILPDPGVGRPAGATGDIAIFSLRKMLPVSFGGVLVDEATHVTEMPPHPLTSRSRLKKHLLMLAENIAFKTGFNLLPAKIALRKRLGNTDSDGSEGGNVYRIPSWKSSRLGPGSKYLRAVIGRRNKNYRYFQKLIQGADSLCVPFPELPAGSCPMFFPLVIKSPGKILKQLHRHGIEAVIWPGDDKVRVNPGVFPGTGYWHDNLILLPVHQELHGSHLDRMVHTLRSIVA